MPFGPGVRHVAILGIAQPCPKCGHPSQIIPGTYDATQDGLNVLIDPSISPDALAAIKHLALRLKNAEITPEQAKKEAEKISPKLGKLFDISGWSDQAKATLYAAVIAAATAVSVAKMTSTPKETTIINQIFIEQSVSRKNKLSSSTTIPNKSIPFPKPRPKGN
jgi:hypothetical protein